MYFADNMNFQYFFFDTYPGYCMEALPVALIVSVIYGVIKYKKAGKIPVSKKLLSCAFICYMTGVVCLVLAIDVIRIGWYELLYHMPGGIVIRSFTAEINFVPDFWTHLNGETIGNFIMFLPFGILYPLARKQTTWKKTLSARFFTSVVIEIFQPVFGRTFDINDIILNTAGVLLSSTVFWGIRKLLRLVRER